MRKLASIQVVREVVKHHNADSLDIITVNDWQLVSGTGNFKAGDLCVYFEIDSFLPVHEEFEFLRKGYYKDMKGVNGLGEGFRLKTIKLRGELSQGLALPISILESFKKQNGVDGVSFQPVAISDYGSLPYLPLTSESAEGTDVTEYLGVQKYEAPVPSNLSGVARGNFPSFIPKTDQERIQNIFNKLKRYTEDCDDWEATLKLDGSSMTVYFNEGTFGVCSRNLDLEDIGDNSFWRVAREKDLAQKLANVCAFYSQDFAIQGELMGPGVQGNREQLPNLDLYVFNVWNITEQRFMSPEVCNAITKALGLNHAPVIDEHFKIQNMTVADILEFVDRPSIKHQIAEGVVFKNNAKPEHSFKCINNRYLLKEKD